MTLATPLSPAAHSAAFERFPVASLMNVTQRPPAVFTHGRGCWLWDSEGRAYLDLVQGWAVNTLGHAPPAIATALAGAEHHRRRSRARVVVAGQLNRSLTAPRRSLATACR